MAWKVRDLLRAVSTILMIPTVAAQCANPVTLQSYSFCAPVGWRVEQNTGPDVATVCDSQKPCSTYVGAPPKGLTFLFVKAEDGIDGHTKYGSAREILAAIPHAGLPDPEIVEVQLATSVHRTVPALWRDAS